MDEPAVASVFTMASTHFKIVVVSPTAPLYNEVNDLLKTVAFYVVAFELIALLILFFVQRRFFILPLSRLASEVQRQTGSASDLALPTSEKTEIGLLAQSFNKQMQQLIHARTEAECAQDAQKKLWLH